MNALEVKAAKFTQVKWNPQHTSFIAVCPGSNGKPHNIACGPKTSCLGYPKCSDELIGKFFANGNARVAEVRGPAEAPRSPANGYGVPPDSSVESKKEPSPRQQKQRSQATSSDDILRRVPPQNIEAEQSVLGAILLENSAIEEAIRTIKTTDFYREAHRMIFDAMLTIRQTNAPIDAITLCQELKTRHQLEQIAGPAYVAELAAVVPTAQNIEHYARIVRDMAVKRDIGTKATWLASLAYDGVSVDALLGEVQRTLAPMRADANEIAGFKKTTVEVLSWRQMQQRRELHRRDWAVEGLLARRETSSWSGKVEAGKTTLMRELTMAVIRGDPFLGRNTVRGRVCYAMLDADGEDVTYDEFEKLGFRPSDEEWCKFIFEPNMSQIEGGVEQFMRILRDFEPALVIIDPYPRLKIIEDFHSYTNTYLMGFLSHLAKLLDAHLALPGHIPRGRSDDDDVATASFGSIAFSGGVNARFVVTNRSGIHTIRSSAGKAAGFVPFDAEHVLELDRDTRRINLGEPFSWKDKGRAAADPVAAFLAANNDRPFVLNTLAREIHLQKSVVRTALGHLFNRGDIRREGEGLKKSPFVYASRTYEGRMTMDEVKGE